jgi:hypothetical protein
MLENELAANYVPHNFYCFAIDRKSSDLFHRQIHALAKCVGDNVVVLDRDQEMEMDSYGQNLVSREKDDLYLGAIGEMAQKLKILPSLPII